MEYTFTMTIDVTDPQGKKMNIIKMEMRSDPLDYERNLGALVHSFAIVKNSLEGSQ